MKHGLRALRWGASLAILWAASGCANQRALEYAHIDDTTWLSQKTVQVLPVDITFAPSWVRQQRKNHSAADITQLQTRYSQALTRGLIRAFEQHGVTVMPTSLPPHTTQHTGTVAQLKLEQLRINAPDFNGHFVDLYTPQQHGSAHFSLVMTQAGQPVAHFKDTRDVLHGPINQLTRTNRVLNLTVFNRAVSRFINDALSAEYEKISHRYQSESQSGR